MSGGSPTPSEGDFSKKRKKIIFRSKKYKLFKIKGIVPWGHSKLVMTIKGVFGCIYGVFETFEGVGLG